MDGTLCCFPNLRHLQSNGHSTSSCSAAAGGCACVSSLSDSVCMHAIPCTAKSCGSLCQLGACPLLPFTCFTQRSKDRGVLCQLASCPLLPFVCFTKRSAMLTLVCVFVHVQMDNQICGNSGYAPPPHTHRYVRGTRIPFSAFHPLSRPGRLTAFYGCREGVLLTAYNK